MIEVQASSSYEIYQEIEKQSYLLIEYIQANLDKLNIDQSSSD